MREILVAEDNALLAKGICTALKSERYRVRHVADGAAALAAIAERRPDVLILDIMMPEMDGLAVCRTIRRTDAHLPILMLTARVLDEQKVEGLSAGADDYLPKPFAMKELLARITAITRRRTSYDPVCLGYGDFSLNGETLELRSENSVRLSLKEYELLRLFISNSGKVLSDRFIIEHIWNSEPTAGPDTVYLYVSYLRRKLGQICSKAEITGDRGSGYCLNSFRA